MRQAIRTRPQGSFWDQVDRTPDVGKLEMIWVTRPGNPGVLVPVAKFRDQEVVTPHPRGRGLSDVHSHIKIKLSDGVLPSSSDIVSIFNDIKRTQFRKWRIVLVSSKGKAMGAISLWASPRFVRFVKKNNPGFKLLLNALRSFSGFPISESGARSSAMSHKIIAAERTLLGVLKREGLEYRFTARSGYTHTPSTLSFRKTRYEK